MKLVQSIEHPGESGRGRENVVATFLRRFLPRGYDISTGFVIDGTGNKSRQIDLVIHYTERHPIFEIAGIKHFLVEAVVAVIENKAMIRSTRDLNAGLDNILSIKRLNREIVGAAGRLPLHSKSARGPSDRFTRSIFGAITTERLPSVALTRRVLTSFLAAHEPWYWPNLLVALDPDDERIVSYCAAGPPGRRMRTVDPFEAVAVATSRGKNLPHAPLVYLAFEIANVIRTVDVYDYDPHAYLVRDDFAMDEWPLL
jgi:hypothetical protein